MASWPRYCKIKQHSLSRLPFDVLQRQMLKSHIHSLQCALVRNLTSFTRCSRVVSFCTLAKNVEEAGVAYKRKCAGPLRNRNAVAPKGKERRARNLVKNLSHDTLTGQAGLTLNSASKIPRTSATGYRYLHIRCESSHVS